MHRFRLSSLLLLAATCVLMASVVSTERVATCNFGPRVHRLSCEIGVISVQDALYGRANTQTCSLGRPASQIQNTQCAQEDTVDLMKSRCNGKKVCEFNTNILHLADPCPGTLKYLETNYTCLPATHLVTCVYSQAYLYCDEGQVIYIYGADYGRRDKTTCASGRPWLQIQNVNCSNSTTKVAESCNGKNSCEIFVSDQVLGDHCTGTDKYLEVAYICQ
ncbi:L-rhamnose-binding lectin SML-like [Cheilinus undulatus]|uniref:L-rhamnose-binding lectin SML-like n=1 Tax=Cheilinus undulatus TaxID=241271 RepID=UPI001BD5E65A|nr:L-rhamnose-binding lectin SML-like [Cheilinus undulatus]